MLVWVSLAGVSLRVHGELVWWHGYLTTSRTQTFMLGGLKNQILWTFDWNNKRPSATSPPFELIDPATCRALPGRSSGPDGPWGGLPCGWHQRDYDHGWQQNHGRSHQSLLRTTNWLPQWMASHTHLSSSKIRGYVTSHIPMTCITSLFKGNPNESLVKYWICGANMGMGQYL